MQGQALLDCGKVVFDELRQGLRHMAFLADPTVGEVKVGGNEPIIAGLVPAVFARLRDKYPGASVHVVQGSTSEQQQDALSQRRVDLVLARRPQSLLPSINAEVLYSERSYVVASQSSRWAKRRKMTFAEIADQPWALPPPGTLVGEIFEQAFKEAGHVYPSRNVAFGQTHLHLTLVMTGQFLAIMLGSLLRLHADRFGIKRLPVEAPIPPWPVAIMTLKNRSLSPMVQRFIDNVRVVAKDVR
jgi:DNA-binding transcriptional LysR family regulator